MASIRKEFNIQAKPEAVWDAIKDFGNAHTRLFPGILSDVQLDGEAARIVTFSNGTVIRERIVDMDDTARRFAYTASGGVTTHHNASVQVTEEDGQSRIVWVSDFLPNEVAPAIQSLVDMGASTMQRTLEQN